jgi:hypothetical protein
MLVSVCNRLFIKAEYSSSSIAIVFSCISRNSFSKIFFAAARMFKRLDLSCSSAKRLDAFDEDFDKSSVDSNSFDA